MYSSEQMQLNEIYYNCIECSSNIEILSINNNLIEFKCLNNHYTKLLINEYIEKMKDYNDKDTNNDICNKHNKKYEVYCNECKIHLCKECLKLRNHINHNKINIIEIQPNKNELNIIKDIIIYYNNRIEYLEKEKLNKAKELGEKMKIYKNKLNNNKEKKINELKNNLNEELKLNNDNYNIDLNKIITRYKIEIKLRKLKYENEKKEIYNK